MRIAGGENKRKETEDMDSYKANLILTGDCFDQMKGLDRNSVDLIVTSPPYADARKSTYGGIRPDEYVDWFLPRSKEFLRVLKPTGSFVLNIKEKALNGQRHTYVLRLILALQKQGWFWVEEYIWHKNNSVPGKWTNRFRDGWERVLHFTKNLSGFKMNQDAVRVPIGDWAKNQRKGLRQRDYRRERSNGSGFGTNDSYWLDKDTVLPDNVLHLASECSNRNHSAAFPESLPEFFIKLFTDEGDVVLDPFAGSGTTLAVAKRLDRRYIGIERLQKYVDVIQQRLGEDEPLITVPAYAWITAVGGTAMGARTEQEYEALREEILAVCAIELAA
jgi:site-specific DNA-methyltransferase (adenine-specific)/site-specific DNA-methyltransferase (cytosine-N4-specific)